MLHDLEGWLAKVANLPTELVELEIDDTLAERMDGMANAAVKTHTFDRERLREKTMANRATIMISALSVSFRRCLLS
jgi:hypothetical protein